MSELIERNILLIDDDHDNRVALRMALESSGYTVQTAANGKIALGILEKMKALPDLVLLDMVMPLMDGEEFLNITDSLPRYQDLQILVMSSFKEKLDQMKNKRPVLLKPVDLTEFVSKVASFFPAV